MKFALILFSGLLILSVLANAETEQQVIEQGRYLFEASGCMHCHTQDKLKPLSGGKGIPKPFGVFYAPNISMDKKTGIGNWSDVQFLNALRKGKNPKGQNYFPVFPFTSYAKMTNADILSMKRYLETQPAYQVANKSHQVRFPYNIRSLVSVWRYFNFSNSKGRFNIIPSLPSNAQDPEWNRGAYLVEATLHCTQCHTPRNAMGGFKFKQWMGGSKISGGKKPAPNLTSSKTFGLGKWSAEDWDLFLTTGMNPDATMVGGEMAQVVDFGTAKLTDEDRKAVIKYLMSLPAVETESP